MRWSIDKITAGFGFALLVLSIIILASRGSASSLLALGTLLAFATAAGVVAIVRRESQKRRQAEAERDRFFALSLDMLCIAKSDGYFKRLSPAFTQTLGWSVEEMLARPFLDFVHPDDRAATLREVERQIVAGEQVLQFENRYQHKDGSWRVLSWTSTPGPGGFMYAAARDVTELKRMADELRAKERRYHTLFDSIDEGYCIIEMIFDEPGKPVDYRFLEVNAAFEQQTGLVAAQGKRMRELAPRHEAHWFETYGEIALTGEPKRFQNRAEQLGRWYDVYAFRYGDPQARQVAILFNDITDRKRVEQEVQAVNRKLQEANKELEAFSYSVSHDLRAPLRHLDGFVKLLRKHEEGRLDATASRYLDVIAQSAAKMGRLIDDLLAFSRTGRADLQMQEVALDDLVRETQRELAARDHRRITWQLMPLPAVRGDPALLRLVWTNLLSNAVKYTAPRPEAQIEIGATPGENGEVVCFVRDNGVGFDARYTDKLFGVFQRLHRDDEFEGTGIGLATVRRIVHRHGGRVWAEGEVDRGATFYLSLKAA